MIHVNVNTFLYISKEVTIIKIVDFKDWFWEKFDDWRGKTTNGPTAFARYLGIPQQHVSAWLQGKYKPKSAQHIAKVAEKYPEIYDVLGVPKPEPPPDPLAVLPLAMRARLEEAMREIETTLASKQVDSNSQEGKAIVSKILDAHGFTVREIKND